MKNDYIKYEIYLNTQLFRYKGGQKKIMLNG